MKLLYITASLPFGSGEAFLLPEITELSHRGYDLSIVPMWPRGKAVYEIQCSSSIVVIGKGLLSLVFLPAVLRYMCCHPLRFIQLVRDLTSCNWVGRLKNLAVLPKSIWLGARVRCIGVQHIHAHWGGASSTMAMVLSRLTGIPWSMTCHRWDIYANNMLAQKSRSAVFTRFISEQGRREGLKRGVDASKVTVIHMGVRDVADTPVKERPASKPVIACPANLIEVKGHQYLIDAVHLLKQEGLKISVHLYGDGPLRQSLERRCRELGFDDEIKFKGHIQHAALLSAYKSGEVDLVVLPSVDLGNGEHEGIPVSLMEAMGFGIPVVSTSTGSIPELLPPHLGLTVPHQDAIALSKKIHELLSNPVRYHQAAFDVLSVVRNGWRVSDSVDALGIQIFGGSRPIVPVSAKRR